MIPKYYEVVPITEKPEKADYYLVVDPENPGLSQAFYFLEDDWFESEGEARENEDHDALDVDGCSWLRPLTFLPIDRETAEKIFEAGATSYREAKRCFGNSEFDMKYYEKLKFEHLKQFS